MKTLYPKIAAIVFGSALCTLSCTKDEFQLSSEQELNAVSAKASFPTTQVQFEAPTLAKPLPDNSMFNDIPFDLSTVVEPSKCTLTPLDDVIAASVASNLDSIGLDWYDLYAEMNFLSTITDEDPQYFGANGEDTQRVNRITRNLERFWFMPHEVTVRGQHNSTLEDYDKIVDILMFWYELPASDANAFAYYFTNFVNVESTFLTETPLLSADGFAIALDGLFGQNDLIVVGDGIVDLLEQTGIRRGVIWNGILAHEWAHHIQFNNEDWYPDGAADNAPEATRTTELEADFFTGYYVTHKKGATQNWKRTQQFLELFFNIGDCSFTSDGHHGTPLQRMEAARRGYLLARRIQDKGKVLTADQVHKRFLNQLDKIVGTSSSTAMEEIEDEYQLDVAPDALQ
ncbi:neutral zinc metallopeptidase [Pseudozobellia thermophila]|uniref:Uncharacterized protein n=1 Tax=Pseudozobellia thermophila TaxID=192903 RepID=A0A1M6N4Z3_9FLAO|nr:hypothetical protein [Pseudozobellia thermophila]SHJ90722.1 hypothetical protein SAMN04488513_11225 [Pseudozobellia thermophila]